MKTHRHCFALDLINDAELILAYKKHHEKVWPEIIKSIKNSGIVGLDIYLVENRLFMIMEVNEEFCFELKAESDANNQKVQEWESLMWKYQQALPSVKKGEKWLLMDKIFELKS
jgi:L-rhamnose mutarotase